MREPAFEARLPLCKQSTPPLQSTPPQAFIEREHEFRFLAVRPQPMHAAGSGAGGGASRSSGSGSGGSSSSDDQGQEQERLAVVCSRWSDAEYRAHPRCPPSEWERRYAAHGVTRIWTDDVLPCRVYLRHCVLAARALGQPALDSFLDHTFLSDRRTTIRAWLGSEGGRGIMEEGPPPGLVGRYSG